MELPVWHFVGIGSGLIIGIVSVLHVFVAQFAVGGGIYLVWMERRAYRDGAPEILQWLERHTHFFLLLTIHNLLIRLLCTYFLNLLIIFFR